jgi:hypothetical protein
MHGSIDSQGERGQCVGRASWNGRECDADEDEDERT